MTTPAEPPTNNAGQDSAPGQQPPASTGTGASNPASGSSSAYSAATWRDEGIRIFAVVGVIAVVAAILASISIATVGLAAAVIDDRQDYRMSDRGRFGDEPRSQGRSDRMSPHGSDGGARVRDLMSGFELFNTMQHGDLVVTGPDGKPVTKRLARGTVSSIDATTVTVTCADGAAIAFTIAPTTTASQAGEAVAVSSVSVGSSAFVIGTVSGEAATADRITVTK